MIVSGACEIEIQMSGKYAEANLMLVRAPPIDFWRASVLLFNDCLLSNNEGGYTTYDFANVVSWITAPNVCSYTNYSLRIECLR